MRLYDDKPGFYDAWDILPDYEEKEVPLTLLEPLRLTLLTPEIAEFTVAEGTEKSRITRVIRLFRDTTAVEVEVCADWHEEHKLLKVGFPTDLHVSSLVTDTSAGFMRRPLHKNTNWEQARFEVCCHKYFVLDAETRGVVVINDGKYGVGVTKNGVSLSLLRSTERPDPMSDRGVHRFCYKIEPLRAHFSACFVPEKAAQYNSPLVLCDGLDLPAYLRQLVSHEIFDVAAVKRSEDGRRTVVRLVETKGQTGQIRLQRKVTLCDLLERPEKETQVLSYRPFEILTFALPLA